MKRSFKYAVGFVLLIAVSVVYSYFTVSSTKPDDAELNTALKQLPKNTRYVILVDFSRPSAQERLFIYDIVEKKYVYSGVVQHGIGRNSKSRHPEFSNDINSNCSSLGMYRVAEYSNIKSIKHINVPCF